jgi:hypothetical protein
VSAPVSGLAANTTYHFRISATNAGGTSKGSDQSFKTKAPAIPTAATGEASAVAQTTAMLNAAVNPSGASLTECRFEYGTTTAYGSSATCSPLPVSAESIFLAVSAPLSGLSQNTTYHFRIVARNPNGPAAESGDASFKTLPNPPAAASGEATAVTQTSATPGATGSGGAAGRPVPAVSLLTTSLVASRSGVLAVKLLCPAAVSTCIGKITLRALTVAKTGARSKRSKSALTLTHGSFALAGGQTKGLKLRLTTAATALLSRSSKLRGDATIVAHDAAGANAATLANVTLRMKR